MRALKVDANQAAIVDALRMAGVSVWVIGSPCDLLVYHRGRWQVLEVKRPEWKRPRKDQAEQTEFLKHYQVPIVKDATEALQWTMNTIQRR